MNATLRQIVKHRTRLPVRRAVLPQHNLHLASGRPAPRTTLLSAPSAEHLAAQEVDADVLPPQSTHLGITERAAEQLCAIAVREDDAGAALRIAVESGGCHGYQYRMELARRREADDYHFAHPTLRPSNIFVDAVSMPLLNGSTIDFTTELIGSSFRVLDNPQAQGSGCGCGVSWELKP